MIDRTIEHIKRHNDEPSLDKKLEKWMSELKLSAINTLEIEDKLQQGDRYDISLPH